MNSTHVINIHSEKEHLYFLKRKYYVDIIGGLKIEQNDFSISLRNTANDKIVYPKQCFWKVGREVNGRKQKRLLTIQIPESETYEVIFHNPKNLLVAESPIKLLFSPFEEKPIDNRKITIEFY